MKIIILILGIIIGITAAHVLMAQQEGAIIYSTKVNMHRTLPPDRPEMKDMVPEFNTYKSQLSFKDQQSYFTPIEEHEEEEFGDDNGPVQLRIRRPQTDYYFDHATGKRITVREFFGKYFLIEDSITVLPWKFASETKTLLGQECKKATWFDEYRKQNVIAWYCEKMKPLIGPEEFNSLPGTVLEIDINNGERVITAESVKFGAPAKIEIVVPSKGQRTTEAEFRKMVEEHRKRMGGQGNVIIRN